MDLVNFTRIASIVPPRHLIYILNSIFSAADAVMQKHGLEKIKTIGDAYMAVAGAPVSDANHTVNAAAAALDLLEEMNNLNIVVPEELGDRSWTSEVGEIQVRIGLHCGTAIGGVIGDKKYSFDLWGDAINTAARMEQFGEAGKIHCSETFARELGMTNEESGMKEGDAQLVIRNSQFLISSRGEMDIKGKGKMQTFFLEKQST
jgi:class 3 adenylate cyclase